jgi:hypothetical protein
MNSIERNNAFRIGKGSQMLPPPTFRTCCMSLRCPRTADQPECGGLEKDVELVG